VIKITTYKWAFKTLSLQSFDEATRPICYYWSNYVLENTWRRCFEFAQNCFRNHLKLKNLYNLSLISGKFCEIFTDRPTYLENLFFVVGNAEDGGRIRRIKKCLLWKPSTFRVILPCCGEAIPSRVLCWCCTIERHSVPECSAIWRNKNVCDKRAKEYKRSTSKSVGANNKKSKKKCATRSVLES
jgi:hypothetical protein